jgi:transposase
MINTVTISVSEYEELKALRSLPALLKELQSQLDWCKSQLDWCKRQIFGQKSERLVDLPGETCDLPGFEMPEAEDVKPEVIKVPEHKRTKTIKKGSCTVEIPDNLERVEQLIDVPEMERTMPDGTKLIKIDEDRSEKLAFRPGEYYVKVIIRPKYAHPTEPKLGVIQEAMPSAIIEGSKFDVSFMAHVVVEKFVFHMPLYRIVEKLQSRDIRVTRQVLSQQIKTCGQNILPLFHLMIEKVLAQGVIYTDDSPVKLLQKKKCKEARIWVYIGGLPNAPPYHIYQFTIDRSHRHPMKFLKNFKGTFHADAFGAYEKLGKQEDISWAACWAHARRKFETALTGTSTDLSLWTMRQMRYLFMYERIAWKRSPEERHNIRQKYERPIVDAIFQRFREELKSHTLLPKSNLAKAIGYMQCRPQAFRLYLSDPNLRMDNNTSERAVRKLTIGRKNWMFIGSETAGESMAALLSITQTCRAMGIRPQEYLEDIFRRLLDHPAHRLEELLPDQWMKSRGIKPMPKQK